MNRIRRWTTGAQQLLLMQFSPGMVAPAVPVVHNAYATFLQIDVNTAPQLTTIPTNDTISILEELVSEVKNVMSDHHDLAVRSS